MPSACVGRRKAVKNKLDIVSVLKLTASFIHIRPQEVHCKNCYKVSFKTGVPNFWAPMPDDSSGANTINNRNTVTVNITCLNHPKTALLSSPRPWKNSSTKPVSGAEKVRDAAVKGIEHLL